MRLMLLYMKMDGDNMLEYYESHIPQRQYKNYEHIKVTDAKQIEGFRLAAQEIADGNFVNGPGCR